MPNPDHSLDRRLRMDLAPTLLIIDEFGLWSDERMAAAALSALIPARRERGSIILTANRRFSEWGRC